MAATHRRYYQDDDRALHIDIATFVDRPQPGATTFATLGLSDTPIPGRRCEPGEVFDDVIPRTLSATLRHAMLVPPFLWEEGLDPAVVDYKTVAWLLAVPISDAEAPTPWSPASRRPR